MLVYYQFNTCSALYHHLLSLAHLPKLPAEDAGWGEGGVQEGGGGEGSGAVCLRCLFLDKFDLSSGILRVVQTYGFPQ